MSFLILSLYLFGKTKHYFLLYNSHNVDVKLISSNSADSIMAQNDSVIVPVNYSGSIDFRTMDPEIRKRKFIEYLLPAVVVIREKLLDDLHHVEFIEEKLKNNKEIYSNDSIFLSAMKEKYKTDSLNELKKRIFPHPVSLALTQAVLESGWGTSSICRKGHNLFGVLSFSSEESRLKMQFNDSEDDIYLRTYDDVIQSVEHYFLLISRVSSYKKFREKRWEGAPTPQLLKLLDNYHESDEYEKIARSIIEENKLTRFDIATIDPTYREFRKLSSFLTQY
jgi:Bax protein